MKALGDWLYELKDWDTPVLRRTIVELGKLAIKAERVTPGQIAAVVLHDPLMTLKLLRFVNGASRSRLSHEVMTVETAIMMLGVGPFFYRHANLKSVEEHLSSKNGALPGLMRVLSRSHHAAWQARDWAILHADMKSEELYVAALLNDLGNLTLWAFAPDQAMQIRRESRRKKISLPEAEKAVMGFELKSLQFALSEVWNLPEMMLSAMHDEAAPHPRMHGVVLASTLACRAETGWYDEQLPASYEAIADMLRLPLNEVVSIIHQNAVISARHWQWYGVPPAATWLPMLPGEWPEELVVEEDVAVAAEAVPQKMEGSEVCMMPQPARLQQMTDEISAHLDGSLNLHDMISLVLKGMHEGIALDRVVFALMTTDRGAVKAKYVVGAMPDSPLRQFQFGIPSTGLFGRLMGKVQSVWFNEDNRKALEPLISQEIWQLIGDGDFFAMSLFMNDRPVGLFYADRKHGSCALDERSYQEFKKLCLLAAKGLAHLAKK
ncbi:MAG: HDOD domain-containing protein [Betaproteobacteria bacterium]|nr:HDOD domain-containing protein [Betaproteobacteria bacterium]